jgi:hypothetical protein
MPIIGGTTYENPPEEELAVGKLINASITPLAH